jgi:hypothetical protein
MIRKAMIALAGAFAMAALSLSACSSTSTAETAADRAAREARLEALREAQEQQKSVWESELASESRFQMNINPTPAEERIARKSARTVVRNLNNSKVFVHYLLSKLKENNMPIELAAIPLVESGLNPNVRANGGAHGAWQYKRQTGASVGLSSSGNFDEIYDFVESTDASVRYLGKLYKDLGDWDLVAAAYNQGEYGIKRAVNAAKARGVTHPNLSNVRISRGARAYIQRLHAYADILHNPSKYNVALPDVKNRPAFRKVEVAGRISSISEAAALSGVDLRTLKKLNNGYRSDRLGASASRGLYVPVENASRLEHVLGSYKTESVTGNYLKDVSEASAKESM